MKLKIANVLLGAALLAVFVAPWWVPVGMLLLASVLAVIGTNNLIEEGRS